MQIMEGESHVDRFLVVCLKESRFLHSLSPHWKYWRGHISWNEISVSKMRDFNQILWMVCSVCLIVPFGRALAVVTDRRACNASGYAESAAWSQISFPADQSQALRGIRQYQRSEMANSKFSTAVGLQPQQRLTRESSLALRLPYRRRPSRSINSWASNLLSAHQNDFRRQSRCPNSPRLVRRRISQALAFNNSPVSHVS